MKLIEVVLLAVAGMAGTLARHGVNVGLKSAGWGGWPWATLAVNVAGSFLFGLVWGWTAEQTKWSEGVRLVVLTGFMGAFTTFSTFAFETGQYVRGGQWWMAVVNVAANNVLGIGAFLVAMGVWRRW